jgi:hypothetical protein
MGRSKGALRSALFLLDAAESEEALCQAGAEAYRPIDEIPSTAIKCSQHDLSIEDQSQWKSFRVLI